MKNIRVVPLSLGLVLVVLGAFAGFGYLIPVLLSSLGVSADTSVNQMGPRLIFVMLVPPLAILIGVGIAWLFLPLVCRLFMTGLTAARD